LSLTNKTVIFSRQILMLCQSLAIDEAIFFIRVHQLSGTDRISFSGVLFFPFEPEIILSHETNLRLFPVWT